MLEGVSESVLEGVLEGVSEGVSSRVCRATFPCDGPAATEKGCPSNLR